MDHSTEKNLLLLGKSGTGKSATGNSILGKEIFKSFTRSEAVTTEVDSGWTKLGGSIVKIVDTPVPAAATFCESYEDEVDQWSKIMEEAMQRTDVGYSAFLFVASLGRFTDEDVNTMKNLQHVLGHDFWEKFGIIILTHGDSFERTAKRNGWTFTDWINKQSRTFKDLLQKCGGRIVLFDNVTEDVTKQTAQIDCLLAEIDKIGTDRYSIGSFKEAQRSYKQHKQASTAGMTSLENEEAGLSDRNTSIVKELEKVKAENKSLRESMWENRLWGGAMLVAGFAGMGVASFFTNLFPKMVAMIVPVAVVSTGKTMKDASKNEEKEKEAKKPNDC